MKEKYKTFKAMIGDELWDLLPSVIVGLTVVVLIFYELIHLICA